MEHIQGTEHTKHGSFLLWWLVCVITHQYTINTKTALFFDKVERAHWVRPVRPA
jgi:hypothetical protein